MTSIVLLNCYFGKYPDYFNLFLDSCKMNPTINYLLFTDNILNNLPQNVTVVNTTFEDIKEKIQSKFDFEISLDAPYKLCDYKPAYGYVFSEYIDGYDYWGYCDVDMIFGNVRGFLTEEILNSHDKFYKLGHLTVFRNTCEINTAFMNEDIVSYKEAFTTKRIAVFDEFEGVQKIFDNQGISTFFSRDYADITAGKNRFTLSNLLVDDPDKNNYKNQVFTYENGHIYRYFEKDGNIGRDEFAYIHMQKRKFKNLLQGVNSYFITYDGFFAMDNDEIDISCIKKFNGIDIIKEISMRYKNKKYHFDRKISKARIKIDEHFTSSANR